MAGNALIRVYKRSLVTSPFVEHRNLKNSRIVIFG